MLRSERQSCSWRGLRGQRVEAVITDQFSGIAGLSARGGQIVLHTFTDALDVLGKTEIVEAIAFVWFSRIGYLSTCDKAFDGVELPLDKAELDLLLVGGGIAAAMNEGQYY